MTPATPVRRVPLRALILSLAALAVPLTSHLVFPGFISGEYGFLVWLTALVPPFLLAYYRGSRGVMVAAAAGMAVLSLTQAAASALGATPPDSKLMLAAVVAYVVISAGVAFMAESLHRQRVAAEQLALLDALTGLPNRRHLESTLDREVAAAARGRPLAVVLFDLDHFKQINDKHGHESGDSAIRAFADILKRRTRRADFAARYGGEEFVAVLTNCRGEGALRFADQVRADLSGRSFAWGKTTVSAGVACYHEGMASHELLLAAADRALYAAKAGGRDKTVLAPKTGETAPEPVAAEPTSAALQGTGRILVVDDDKDVLRAVVRVLQAAGYTVDGVNHPQLAVRRYEAAAASFDLLVTDVLMPDLTGMVMVDLILPHRPDLRVVYLSGYVQRGGVTWAGLPGSVVGFVPKPVDMNELLEVVRDTLTREPPVAEEAAE